MLRPLVPADFPIAAKLLAEGFPARSLAVWEEGLQLLLRHTGNGNCGVPLGYLLEVKGEPVGVALTPATARTRPDGSHRLLINFSSLYIRPDHSWRAVQFFRTVLADPAATYLDLTPAAHVRPMLPLFGFRQVSLGSDMVALPVAALSPGGRGRLRPLEDGDELPPGSPDMGLLMAHRELGCLPLLLDHAEERMLIVYRSRPMRGVPAARLKYIGSHRLLRTHLPLLARYLLVRGFMVLTWDARPELPPPGAGYRRQQLPWFARGEIDTDVTDFIGSELCILGV